ncbi:MAG: GNAT family N-acetyltransferase [Pseudomonadota bacterium]
MSILIRPAGEADVPDLAKLLMLATEGITEAIYHDLIPGKPTNEIVERRFHFKGTTKSFHCCHVAEQSGRVVGKLHAHPIDAVLNDPPDPLVPDDRYAVVEVFDHLDVAAPDSYYINAIAVYPEHRGQGIGGALMAQAEEHARQGGFTTLSLAVFEENEGALRLYRRHGFEEVARHPAAKHPMLHLGGDILMLLKAL